MIELRRNKETGVVEAWKDGKRIGNISTMGDDIDGRTTDKPQARDD